MVKEALKIADTAGSKWQYRYGIFGCKAHSRPLRPHSYKLLTSEQSKKCRLGGGQTWS